MHAAQRTLVLSVPKLRSSNSLTVRAHRLVETRPTALGIALGVPFEQLCAAGRAGVESLALLPEQFAGPRTFGGGLAQNRVLIGGQLLALFAAAHHCTRVVARHSGGAGHAESTRARGEDRQPGFGQASAWRRPTSSSRNWSNFVKMMQYWPGPLRSSVLSEPQGRMKGRDRKGVGERDRNAPIEDRMW